MLSLSADELNQICGKSQQKGLHFGAVSVILIRYTIAFSYPQEVVAPYAYHEPHA
jgi:hypothetical protein